MAFLDDFVGGLRKGNEEESKRSADRQAYSDYRTLRQEQSERFRKLDAQSDGSLLQKMANPSALSNEEKEIVDNILLRRGYTKVGNNYRRR